MTAEVAVDRTFSVDRRKQARCDVRSCVLPTESGPAEIPTAVVDNCRANNLEADLSGAATGRKRLSDH